MGRIVRAAGAQGINQLARVAQLFLLVPICLTAWGTAAYEDWILLNSVTAFLMLADFGLVQLTTVKLLDAWSRDERQLFQQEWAVALGMFAGLALMLICLLGLSLALPGWTVLIPTRELHADQLALAAVLLSSIQVVTILINLGLGVYRARGDLSRSYHVSSILVALQTGAVVVPAVLGDGLVAAAAACCAVTAAMLAAVVADFCWRYPDLGWTPTWPSAQEWRRMWQAVGYLASPVSTTIMVNAPNLILAQSGAPEGAIALFTASRTIAGAARQLPYQFAHPAGVELAALLARGDRERLGGLYASASRVLAIIVGILSGFTIIAAPLVMMLWTRGKIPYDGALMLLLVGATTICAPAQVAYTLLWYGGYPGLLGRGLLCSTGVAMALAMLLSPWFAARGVALGLGVGEIVGTAVYLSFLVDRLLQRKAGSGLLRNFMTALVAFSSSGAVGFVLDRLIAPHGWLGLVVFGSAWSIFAAAGAYRLVLSRAQQARLREVLTTLLRAARARWSVKSANPADIG